MFIAALFRRVKNEINIDIHQVMIKKLGYRYAMESYSTVKKLRPLNFQIAEWK